MSVYFDNVDVAINHSGILAINAALDSNNSIEAAFSLGYYNQNNTTPAGSIVTNFRFEYIPEINYEPNFGIVNKIKNLIPDTGYKGEKIELAGITQDNCFINNYLLRIQPNNMAQASASYVTFFPPCDSIREKNNLINYLNDGSISHAFSTYILNQNDFLTIPVYNLEYNIKLEWNPIYIIGRKYPKDIKLMNIVETLNFSIDTYRNILFSGENVLGTIFNNNNSQNIQFNNISLICSDNCITTGVNADGSLLIPMNKFKINNINVNTTLGEYIRVSYNCIKYS